MKKSVSILMGSKSDLEIMQKAETLLLSFGVECDLHIASAHRTPDKVHKIAQDVEENSDVVIAGAGMAAHLPGVMASLVNKPVIGVPIKSSLDGMDALLAIVQMPPGIPVATVAINGAKNAAILAIQIMALKNEALNEKYKQYRTDLKSGAKP